MRIGIVTDSTCDLPTEIVEPHGIRVVPMYINMGEKSYLDGVDLSREAFYERLPDCDPPPTTAMPSPQLFLDAYQSLAAAGARQIISLHISRELSAVLDGAQLAARQSPVPVTVIDSGSLSLGTGFLAWKAAEAAEQGRGLDEIVALVKDQIRRTHVFAALDTLEYLRRSGRLNRVLATVGGWLRMKPLLKMHDGVAEAERVLTSEAATRRLVELLEERTPLSQVALVHTHSPDKAQALLERARHLLPGDHILSVDITPVFGTHLGPGAAGFCCISAPKSTGS